MTSDNSIAANVLGSAAAGIASRIATHPLDTIKSRLQANQSVDFGSYGSHQQSAASKTPTTTKLQRRPLYNTLKKGLQRQGGISGLYRGLSVVLVGGTPGTIIYLTSYDLWKEQLSKLSLVGSSPQEPLEDSAPPSFAVYLGAGLLAEAVACLIYVPVDVMKERLQVQGRGGAGTTNSNSFHYKSGWDALTTIYQTEGVAGFYRGYAATLLSFGPFSALYFVGYEGLKRRCPVEYQVLQNDNSNSSPLLPPLYWIVGSSAIAGAVASFVTSPLDMAKLRLQVQRAGGGSDKSKITKTGQSSSQYRGVVDCLRQTFQEGGVSGLFRGAGARVLHFVPATTVTMTCYETCRSFFQNVLDGEE